MSDYEAIADLRAELARIGDVLADQRTLVGAINRVEAAITALVEAVQATTTAIHESHGGPLMNKPTKTQITYAAKRVQGAAEQMGIQPIQPWSDLDPVVRDIHRRLARAAIESYREGPDAAREHRQVYRDHGWEW